MQTTVATPSGALEGSAGRGVRVFKGIPYARPPLSGLRFRAPEPVVPWTGVRSARSFGSAAPQVGPANRLIRQFIGVADVAQSQDCLYLNVWTPARKEGARLPVMLWIHGGAFLLGSGSTLIYDGTSLATEGDVVVVTINYRLGALGYLNWRSLASGAELPDANLGLRDQIAALAWVRDHIECFGGDPENVTIFGESAGAMSVGTLLGTPAARGLFHRAILQSGATHNVSTSEQAAITARHFFDELGIEKPTWEVLEGLSVGDLMRAQLRTTTRLGLLEGILPFQPSVDGDVLPEPPLAAIRKGLSRSVPTLLGTNRDEWKLFMVGDPRAGGLDPARLERRFRRILQALGGRTEELVARACDTYRRVKGPWGAEPVERWIAFQSDRIFHYPAACLADAQSAQNPSTYAYLFEWSPPLARRRIGACHGIDLPFVFGTLRHPLLRPLWGSSLGAWKLTRRMQRAWLGFAHTGCPAHDGLPEWPAYSRWHRSTMSLAGQCTLLEDPHQRARGFWAEILRDDKLPWRRR
jgi:para-nitrobenzyl esterase